MHLRHKDLKGKNALVTGAAGVLGFTTSTFLLDSGINVVMVDKYSIDIQRLSRENRGKAYPFTFDISDPHQVDTAMKQILSSVGEIDILINNAGILTNHKVLTTTDEEWRSVISTNLDGAFYLSKALIPGMKERGWGRIINVSSLAAKTGGITAGTAYTTSKGALISLTFSLAAETAAYGITVNGIAPAYINTPMITEQLSEEQRQELLKTIPVHRFCEPEEFVHTVGFLIHPLAGFITGEIIDQNGGLFFD